MCLNYFCADHAHSFLKVVNVMRRLAFKLERWIFGHSTQRFVRKYVSAKCSAGKRRELLRPLHKFDAIRSSTGLALASQAPIPFVDVRGLPVLFAERARVEYVDPAQWPIFHRYGEMVPDRIGNAVAVALSASIVRASPPTRRWFSCVES